MTGTLTHYYLNQEASNHCFFFFFACRLMIKNFPYQTLKKVARKIYQFKIRSGFIIFIDILQFIINK